MRTLRSPAALAALAVAAALALSGCIQRERSSFAPPDRAATGEDASHVHGVGVDPADGALYIATHAGLFRSAAGSTTAEPVGDSRQDTMGFTVVGPRTFLGSGHPDARADAPPNLGLVRSEDAGRTWTPVSLSGEADFHVLRTHGERVYGFDSTRGRLLASADGGLTWAQRSPPAVVFDLAVHPADGDRLIASTERGLAFTRDGGESWRPGRRDAAGLLAWTRDGIVLVDGAGRAHRSVDGTHWQPSGSIGGRPAAMAAHGSDLYVALHTNQVNVSTDGGRTWRLRARL